MTDERLHHRFIIRTVNGELNLLAGDIVGRIRERFAREDIYASCLTCRHMQTDTPSGQPFCKKWNLPPPLEVLVNSCGSEGYEDIDDIPF
jgi:hypothetical protein